MTFLVGVFGGTGNGQGLFIFTLAIQNIDINEREFSRTLRPIGLNTPHPQGLTRPWVNPRDLASRRLGVRGDPRTAQSKCSNGLVIKFEMG